jgi:hypothetical protein
MVTATHVVEVPLPAGLDPTPEERELLERLFAAVAGVRLEPGRDWPRIRTALARNGWSLSWGLQWHVEARRGRELEQSCGVTPDEAFARIWQVTREDMPIEGTP